jgi:anti-sigma B factor antagonist
MELTLSHEDGLVFACLSGAIDESAGPVFRELLHPLVGQKGTRVVMDASKADRITSAGIGQLVVLAAHANSSGSRVVLAACTPFVAIVMNRCKLDKFFEMEEGVPEAIKKLLDTKS